MKEVISFDNFSNINISNYYSTINAIQYVYT